jgi:N-acetylglutamate synthase-like GNAT family acetyltransferase/ADP-ribose pyrophosphatase YjhB (NUDIX family)
MRGKYGQPFHLWMTQEFDEKGWFMVQKSAAQERAHDVTLFIQDPQGRYALMSKHSYPPGVFRSPSGGVEPEESFELGAKREAREETGLDIDLKRFVMHVTLDITHEKELFRWDTYVFSATTDGKRLAFTDRKEVKSATWAMDSQMEEMSRRLRETGNGGLIYRARLSDAYLWSATHPLVLRESSDKGREKIESSTAAKDPRVEKLKDYLWWTAEVHGLYAGSLGLRTHGNFLELVGLNVHPMFRGRGIGHSLVDYAMDRLRQPAFQRTLSSETKLATQGGIWLLSDTPGYFMPSGFKLVKNDQIPAVLVTYLKTAASPTPSALRFHS